MRNMSFMLTIEQFKARTKTVTRRAGWAKLKPGDLVQGCVKCMGLERGEKIVKLGVIQVVSVRAERLDQITAAECVLEGFPDMSPEDFIGLFMTANPEVFPSTMINRIEYRYV